MFAGAVEATSSMGGQIMPPVMGAVAFIMAETLNVPYVEICKAAVIPAILYYITAFWMVHLEAGRANLMGLPKDQCPSPWRHRSGQLVPAAAARRARLHALRRLHADVRRHDGPRAHVDPHPRRRRSPRASGRWRSASSSGSRSGLAAATFLKWGVDAGARGDRRCWSAANFVAQGRPRDAAHHARRASSTAPGRRCPSASRAPSWA